MRSRTPILLALLVFACLPATANARIDLGQRYIAPEAPPRAESQSTGHGVIAPTYLCPGQNEADAPAAVQQDAMRCMVNFARSQSGLGKLNSSDALDKSAEEKSADILRCDSFSHYACGRDFTYWMKNVGYIPARCWQVAENLAWGSGEERSVRSRFRALMRSPGHRDNILGSFSTIGVGLRVGSLDGHSDVHVWTQHFGTHCEG